MTETTIEKQTIYFPPPASKWNHMQQRRARSQHLGSMGESKPSGAVDHSEPQQPLPALTELHSMEKTGWNCVLLSVLSFPLPFFRIIANQKGTVGKAPGMVYSSNHWQLGV